VCARFGSVFLLAWAAFGTAHAGAITVDTTAGLLANAIQPINCSASQSSSQAGSASAASTCGTLNSYPIPYVTSAASGTMGSELFPSVQASASVEAGWSSLLADWGTASVDAAYTENLLITGGTGSGSLILDVSLTAQGSEFGSETGGTLLANVDGASVSTLLNGMPWICSYGGAICSWQPDVPPQYVTIPFTFGVPFSFSEEFTLGAQASDDGSALMSGGMATSIFSILDANGNVVSGAQVTDPPDAPEPGSLILCAGLLGLLMAGEGTRRRRISRQHRLMR
jgi:hypothetical protein